MLFFFVWTLSVCIQYNIIYLTKIDEKIVCFVFKREGQYKKKEQSFFLFCFFLYKIHTDIQWKFYIISFFTSFFFFYNNFIVIEFLFSIVFLKFSKTLAKDFLVFFFFSQITSSYSFNIININELSSLIIGIERKGIAEIVPSLGKELSLSLLFF